MPQTVYFGDKKKNYILWRAKKIYLSYKNLTIFARDVPSLDFCKQNFENYKIGYGFLPVLCYNELKCSEVSLCISL